MRHSAKKAQQSISNFIEKSYNILENEQNSHIVAWTQRGTSFIIKDIKKFQEQILPIYFKHSNFSSFVRQLNMYNFHKVRGDRLDCQFEHEKFKKGQRELLTKIKRKQSESFIISQNIIQDGQLNMSMQESSQNIKKYSENLINLDFLNKDQNKADSGQKNQAMLQELENLRKENKNLRTLKQNKLQKQKMLNSANGSLIGQKFFKLTTCLLASKLQKQLRIQNPFVKEQPQNQLQNCLNFDLILEHILSNSQNSLQFSKYSLTANTLSTQQSNYDFMMKKANKNMNQTEQNSLKI